MTSLVPLVVCCSCVVSVATSFPLKGSSHGIDPNRTIEAVEGDNVPFQYSLDSGEYLVNQTVDWKRNGVVIHLYQYERDQWNYQAAEYRGRTSLDHEDLHRGVVTFHLSKVRLADSGEFCVRMSERGVHFCKELRVVKKQQRRHESSTLGQESSTVGQEYSTVGPSVEDAANVGVDWQLVLGVVVAAAVLILAVGICWRKSGNTRFCPNIASEKTKEMGNFHEMEALGQNTTTERTEEMDH